MGYPRMASAGGTFYSPCNVQIEANPSHTLVSGHILAGKSMRADDQDFQDEISLAWPDPFRAAAYRLEIISAALQG